MFGKNKTQKIKGVNMLKTRIITAVVLLAVLLPIIFSGSLLAFTLVSSLFFGAAMWESQRLFNKPGAKYIAIIWTLMFVYLTLNTAIFSMPTLFSVCILFWMFGYTLKRMIVS